jgi:acyl carrier protein
MGGYRDSLAPADSLANVIDSLGLFDLVEFVENEFGVSIPNDEFSPRRFASIESILGLVDELKTG